MRNENLLIFFKIIAIVFSLLFLILNIASIIYYETKIVFTVLLLLFLIFLISFSIVYFFVNNSISNYKEIMETQNNGVTYRLSKISSNILNDYQNANF